ncbi:hypothetical protein B0T22DRAFT_460751 [Podospora appendiculata]|uniref:Uncharacterized protein n=1 Tax=Podospora appendiculata TaxID=314037 RepID=A0AAE0XB66_9PEZI|nr:hypothetical protein B0T22DRAFT_460751 [Podospora appendiculata]
MARATALRTWKSSISLIQFHSPRPVLCTFSFNVSQHQRLAPPPQSHDCNGIEPRPSFLQRPSCCDLRGLIFSPRQHSTRPQSPHHIQRMAPAQSCAAVRTFPSASHCSFNLPRTRTQTTPLQYQVCTHDRTRQAAGYKLAVFLGTQRRGGELVYAQHCIL